MNSLLPQLLGIRLTDSLWVSTPLWLSPTEQLPSYWPPMTCQHGADIADDPNSRFLMMLEWLHGPTSPSTQSHFFPSLLQAFILRAPTSYTLMFFEESEYWRSQATTALERGRVIQFTTSVFGISIFLT